MTESERIDFLVRTVANGNASEFAERIGANKSVITKLRSPKYPNGIRLYVDKIIRAYPAVNRSWLESGEGYPGDLTIDLVRSHYEAKLRRCEMIIDHLTRRIDELEKRL